MGARREGCGLRRMQAALELEAVTKRYGDFTRSRT